MQHQDGEVRFQEGPGISAATREVIDGLRDLFRAEARLAIEEGKASIGGLGRDAIKALLFGAVALAGLLPILSFLVIGLGRILNDNYWLSSLIVGVVMIAVGAILARKFFKLAFAHDLTLPRTRRSIDRSAQSVSHNVRKLTDFRKIGI